MRLRSRVQRLECRVAGRGGDDNERVEFWFPENGRDGVAPGRYPMLGGRAVLVIYASEQDWSVGEADLAPPRLARGCDRGPRRGGLP
jgi:hypothetical protein